MSSSEGRGCDDDSEKQASFVPADTRRRRFGQGAPLAQRDCMRAWARGCLLGSIVVCFGCSSAAFDTAPSTDEDTGGTGDTGSGTDSGLDDTAVADGGARDTNVDGGSGDVGPG